MLNKNEFVEFQLKIEEGQIQDNVYIKGYEEFGNFEFTNEKSIQKLRIIATKPGAGFPIVTDTDEQVLGMIKVLGSHTADEEVM